MESSKPIITRRTGPGKFHPSMSSTSLSSLPSQANLTTSSTTYNVSRLPKRHSSIKATGSSASRQLLRRHSQGSNRSLGSTVLSTVADDRHQTTFSVPIETGNDLVGIAVPLDTGVTTRNKNQEDSSDDTERENDLSTTAVQRNPNDDRSRKPSTSTIASDPASPNRNRLRASPFTSSSRSTQSSYGKGGNKRKAPSRPTQAPGFALSAAELKHVAMGPDPDLPRPPTLGRPINTSSSFSRSESLSSTSINTAQSGMSARTVTSSNLSASGETASVPSRKAFVQRNGRTYLNDPTLAYPLPVDLTELHRQTMRTLMLIQAHGGPVRSPALLKKPPKKVLEVGCSTGFWSQMCHRFFKSRGHSGISFTGIDIAPVAPGSANIPLDSMKPDKDMDWTFVQHDIRQMPWPFEDGEFDLVFSKDMALATPLAEHPYFSSEILRVLKSGGAFEIWETDYTIRMLRPHVPNTGLTGADVENQEAASTIGSYMVHLNTPLSAPLNTYLVEYNNWVSKALEARGLWPTPGTMMSAYILAEIDVLVGMGVHRVAIPFSEVRWEREGVGGVVTKDGKSYVEMRGDRGPHQKVEKKTLTPAQAALRRTALLTFVEEVQALEPNLREVSGKSQDEWDIWLGKMMNDLVNEGGTSWGECLESGSWWATKR